MIEEEDDEKYPSVPSSTINLNEKQGLSISKSIQYVAKNGDSIQDEDEKHALAFLDKVHAFLFHHKPAPTDDEDSKETELQTGRMSSLSTSHHDAEERGAEL